MLIQENDLVALFSQFPFDAIFKHLLKMDPNIHSKLDSGLFTELLPTIILSSMLLCLTFIWITLHFFLLYVDNLSSTI